MAARRLWLGSGRLDADRCGAMAGGYEVAWQIPGSQQFSIWATDSNGNFTSYNTLSGTGTALELLETSFHQDLNGDGVIGIPVTDDRSRLDRPAWSRSAIIIFSIASAAGLAPS